MNISRVSLIQGRQLALRLVDPEDVAFIRCLRTDQNAIEITAAKVTVRLNNSRTEAFYRRIGMTETHRAVRGIPLLFPPMQFDASKVACPAIMENKI